MLPISTLVIFHNLVVTQKGAGRPAAFAESSRVVMETVTKTSTTTKYSTVQHGGQTQQLHQVQQQTLQGQLPGGEADASKVTVTGAGLHQATVNQESMFSINGSNTGKFSLFSSVFSKLVSEYFY